MNDSTGNMVKISGTTYTYKIITYVTKVNCVSTGIAGTAKVTVNKLQAVTFQDGVCEIISNIGIYTDGFSIVTSFIPVPNVTTIVTVPVWFGYNIFVYCYKKDAVRLLILNVKKLSVF